jgi:hypothetical protein
VTTPHILKRWRIDRIGIALLILGALFLAARAWLADNPQHDPWAPLDLRDPPGMAMQSKIAALRSDPQECRAVLDRSDISYTVLDPAGEGACLRTDRLRPAGGALRPRPEMSCAMLAGYERWIAQSVEPAAAMQFDTDLAGIEHFGTYSCRRLYGRSEGAWSEHATANALDVAAFVLADGTRISVLNDWNEDGEKAAFLRDVTSGACDNFGTVLTPDYNDAHADHLHLDQAGRFTGFCP